jgi:hypothetical protein
MSRRLRTDDSGVASTIATIFSLLVVMMFLNLVMVEIVPRQEYDAEYVTTRAALSAFQQIRGFAQGPMVPMVAGQQGSPVTFAIPLGTQAVSPLEGPTAGILTFDPSAGSSDVSFQFVPNFHQGQIQKNDQDVVLVMDGSGSMAQTDPQRLRVTGAKDYIGRLTCPDHVAIVEFNSVAHLTRENVGGIPHHLTYPSHNCFPDYSEAQSDVDTIGANGFTNIGAALKVAVNELAGYGDRDHVKVIILLTDGENTSPSKAAGDALSLKEAAEARDRGFIVFTIGLGSGADATLLTEIADMTGGTFYSVSNPAAIPWIYYEISRHFAGAFACGDLGTADGGSGRLSLALSNRRYPSQVITYEAGGIVLHQPDGALVTDGPSLAWQAASRHGPAGNLSLDAVTLIGPAFNAEGSGTELVTVRPEGRDRQEIQMTQANLTDIKVALNDESATLNYWTGQGASTSQATASVQNPLGQARGALASAQGHVDAGDYTSAKFSADSASSMLSAAVAAAKAAGNAGTMEQWLADMMTDDILIQACRLTQWSNWYEGVTIRIVGTEAAAWEAWLNRTAKASGMQYVVTHVDDTVSFTVRAVDSLSLNRRIVSISAAG